MAINDSLPGKLAAGAALVRVFAVGRWAVIDTGFHAIGDYEFCTSCHDTMGAIGAACREDIHGGNNATGLRAEGTACHLGPDHPNIEVYNNSKHGHIYHSDSADWKWDAPPDAWEPGDYRAPCHMSGIGSLVTHNASDRTTGICGRRQPRCSMSSARRVC